MTEHKRQDGTKPSSRPDELPPELLTRAGLTMAGASFHTGPNADEYALLPTGADRAEHHVLKLSGDAAVLMCSSVGGGDPARLLANQLDERLQAHADRFFAWLDRRIETVSANVAIPLRNAGYDVIHTGGGCLAWMRPLTDGGESYILITNDVDIEGDPDAAEWVVGRYNGDDFIDIDQGFTLADAIRIADQLPPPNPSGRGIVQATFPTLAAALEAHWEPPPG
jgi:hypothetical protein